MAAGYNRGMNKADILDYLESNQDPRGIEHWKRFAEASGGLKSYGMGAAIVPLVAWGHQLGYGFNTQYALLAGCAIAVLAAACFLPALRGNTKTEPLLEK